MTSKETVSAIRKLLGSFGMNVIEVADVPSFAADRVFCGMMLEAVRIHADTGLGPAQIDDVCKREFGTSPFFVHNLIAGANYLSAHCMELMQEEVDSSLYAIPEVWRPYLADPTKQWPYERGATCPPERRLEVRDRMLGMLFAITAYEIAHDIANPSVLNFLCENALAFRLGTPALAESIGFEEARRIGRAFLDGQRITHADEVAPLAVLSADQPGFTSIYVETAVHGEVGLISLKRTTLNHVFMREFDAAYERLAANAAVKAIVIAPDGSFSREFGHGADANCFVPVLGKYDDALALIQGWKKTLAKLRRGKPTVAALVGRVLGGGLEFASNCHARIAAAGTRLGQPEPNVGVVPGLGGCHHIHRFSSATAYARINELLLTGHTFRAEEAVEWGFVSTTVPVRDLPRESMALAASFAADPTRLPSFREGPASVAVHRDVDPRSETGVPLDRELRELIATTIEETNALPYGEASALEERAAARSLTLSSSKIGVNALLRGKPPQFENPLA